ncbi:UPF0561 protein C2orf68 homolog [Amphiura filiformis]|uniref:UPF0561 protein C2orf68 homolog n=1 Tax=Amphiura filiformis TaxID=82378 RepID=UPI003B213F2C
MPPTNEPATGPSKKLDQNSEPATALDELVLFKLEYEDEDGDISKLLVLKDDDPHEIAAEFAQECGIHDSLVDALVYRIEQEMKKRVK